MTNDAFAKKLANENPYVFYTIHIFYKQNMFNIQVNQYNFTKPHLRLFIRPPVAKHYSGFIYLNYDFKAFSFDTNYFLIINNIIRNVSYDNKSAFPVRNKSK